MISITLVSQNLAPFRLYLSSFRGAGPIFETRHSLIRCSRLASIPSIDAPHVANSAIGPSALERNSLALYQQVTSSSYSIIVLHSCNLFHLTTNLSIQKQPNGYKYWANIGIHSRLSVICMSVGPSEILPFVASHRGSTEMVLGEVRNFGQRTYRGSQWGGGRRVKVGK